MIVGLTGGIGSGKSTVAKMFAQLGVPVYTADDEAKKLMATQEVKQQIVAHFGENSYNGNMPNRAFLASIVFNEPRELDKLNAIIHPMVRAHFKQWYKKQTAPYVIKEVAILFETGGQADCDATILVTAPYQERIERVMLRDNVPVKEVEERMNNQWSDEKKVPLADYVLNNENIQKTELEVVQLHRILMEKSKAK